MDDQIGWDTTMITHSFPEDRALKKSELMYDMKVGGPDGATFRTTKLLNDLGARTIRGRGTRVWEVNKVTVTQKRTRHTSESLGPSVALKDSWVDADRLREAEVLDKLEQPSTSRPFKYAMKTHVISIECYGGVEIDGQPDHTRALHTNGRAIPFLSSTLPRLPFISSAVVGECYKESNYVSKVSRQELASSSNAFNAQEEVASEKMHHRSVFEQLGVSLYEQTKPADTFLALSQICIRAFILL